MSLQDYLYDGVSENPDIEMILREDLEKSAVIVFKDSFRGYYYRNMERFLAKNHFRNSVDIMSEKFLKGLIREIKRYNVSRNMFDEYREVIEFLVGVLRNTEENGNRATTEEDYVWLGF